jgi:hypothetical protein
MEIVAWFVGCLAEDIQDSKALLKDSFLRGIRSVEQFGPEAHDHAENKMLVDEKC